MIFITTWWASCQCRCFKTKSRIGSHNATLSRKNILYCFISRPLTGADIFEITPSDPYTDDDLDWTDNNSRVVAEHNDPDGRHVELETTDVPDWASYDTVYIGAPIWWGEFSWVIDDFVKNNDFTGKTVIPFCTSMSSGLGDSGKHVAEMASSGNWLDGKRFGTRASETEVQEWIDSLELN